MREQAISSWSSRLAYAVGLIATDGSLSKDGRHINLTSKDLEQLHNFNTCLSKDCRIAWKKGGYTGRKCPYIEFSDVRLYRWLNKIGLTPNKTKTISALKIPLKYFPDFLRGHFDGDGSVYAFWDNRWRSSFMIQLSFISASAEHINWLDSMTQKVFGAKGSIGRGNRVYRLTFYKKDSIVILSKIYKQRGICLSRKKNKVLRILEQAAVLELADRHA